MSWIITGKEAGSLGLLDQYGGAVAAYSLRNLSLYRTDPVVRVRRDNDNAEQDFTATEVSDGTLAAWVGAGNDGFVRTWYDQSGNNRHCQQSVAATQPVIVLNGTLQKLNNRPSLNFSTDRFFDRVITTSPLKSFVFIGQARQPDVTSRNVGSHCGVGGALSSSFVFGNFTGSLTGESLTFYDGGSFVYTKYGFTDNQTALVSIFFTAPSNASIYAQGSEVPVFSNSHGISNADFQIGKRINFLQYYNAFLPEWIMWPVDYESGASGIHANINAYYNIF